MLHRHSNLVSSAGLDGNLDVRRTVVCFQHVIVRHGLLSFWVRFVDRFDVEMLVLHQPASHRARGCRGLSLNQCTIRAMDVSVVKLLLKVVFGLLVLGKNHDSRRLFVKPVHDEAPRLGIGLTYVLDAATVERINFQSVRGNGQELGWFVDHQQRIVFKQDVKVNGGCGFWRWCARLCALPFENLNRITVGELVLGTVHDLPVQHHSALCEHFTKG